MVALRLWLSLRSRDSNNDEENILANSQSARRRGLYLVYKIPPLLNNHAVLINDDRHFTHLQATRQSISLPRDGRAWTNDASDQAGQCALQRLVTLTFDKRRLTD